METDVLEVEEGVWEPLVTNSPLLAQEKYPHERALCYWFMLNPAESVAAWKNHVSKIENPGKALLQSDKCRLLVGKIVSLYKQHGMERVSLMTLKEHCTPEEIESFGGWKHIVEHFEFMLIGSGFHDLMGTLLDHYRVREFQRLVDFAAESANDGKSLNDVIAMVGEKTRTLLKVDAGMMTPTVDICVNEIEKKIREDSTDESIPSTFRSFAGMVKEYQRGQIALVGAPPGNGKTAWAMQEIQCALEHGFTVDAFLMESTFSQFTDRYIMRNFAVKGGRLNRKSFTQDELRAIQDGMESLNRFENRLYLAPMANYTAGGIDAMLQERKAATGRGIDLIVIDHLDCMSIPREKGQSQFDAMKETVLQLRGIATRENAAMLLCAQLSVDAIRNSVGQKERLPTIDAFRGGTPTESAKVVVILNKDKQAMLDGTPYVEQQAVICKANDGETGFVRMLFLKPFAKHIEDTSPACRVQYKRWLDALEFPMDYQRKDVRK